MSVYLVTWDIRATPAGAYDEARKRFLDNLGARYPDNYSDPSLSTVRFISTTDDPNQVSDELRRALDETDRIVVTKMNSGEHQGWLARDVWDWINIRL